MKIIHICIDHSSSDALKQASFLHNGLNEFGFSSFLIANKSNQLYDTVNTTSKNVFDFEIKKNKPFSLPKELKSIISNIDPDIIHYHDSKSIYFSKWFTKYDQLATRRVPYPIKYISRIGKYKNIDQFVGVSKEITNYLSRYFKNCTTIHSGVSIEEFENPSLLSSFDQTKTNLLFVGAFDKQKGVDVLFNAFNRIHQKDVHLHLVGTGELEDKVKEIVQKLKLDHIIHFHGYQQDLKDYYFSSDIVIIPSIRGEGSSGVIKEAMVCGKPIIASDLKGNLELFENKQTGISFVNRDENDLYEKIMLLLNEEIIFDRQLIKAASLSFSKEKMIKEYIEIYNQTIS